MWQQQDREELDRRAREGETVVPGGTGGKSLEAQEHLAQGRSRVDRRGRSSWEVKDTKRSWAAREVSPPLIYGDRPAREGSVDIGQTNFTT